MNLEEARAADVDVDREAGQILGGDTGVKCNEKLVSEGNEMTMARGVPGPEILHNREYSSNPAGGMALWLPKRFPAIFIFLSILTITLYHQMGLSALNPRESNTRLDFLSSIWRLGGNSLSL